MKHNPPPLSCVLGSKQTGARMNMKSIISRTESLQILKNQLRKDALEKRAAELKDANAEKREAILAEIERNIQREVKERAWTPGFGRVIH